MHIFYTPCTEFLNENPGIKVCQLPSYPNWLLAQALARPGHTPQSRNHHNKATHFVRLFVSPLAASPSATRIHFALHCQFCGIWIIVFALAGTWDDHTASNIILSP
jgi:hypothetical protein